MAGCKGAKKLMAINPDNEASIFASADYAVIGDLHEVVPAISAEIRKTRSVAAPQRQRITSLISALALAAALAVSGTLFATRAALLVRTRSEGGADQAPRATYPRRARNEAEIVLGQRKLLQRLGPGLLARVHLLGLPRCCVPTILIALIGIVDKHSTLPWLGHQGWYALLVDIFCVLVLAGVIGALWIRKVQRPRRFEGSHLGEADLILALIATIVISSAALARDPDRAPPERMAGVSGRPVSNALSHLFADNQTTRVLERVFVWIHVLTILSFLAYLPRSKHLHIFVAAVNVWFGRTRAEGRLEPLKFDDPDVPEEELSFGAGTAPDLTWKQVLDTFSCTECGRCQDACPAFATGKILSPKLVIMGLRDLRARPGHRHAARSPRRGVPADMVWDCVTCGACVQACPVSIEHVDHIVDLRRHLVMVESSFPTEAEPMLRDVERASNPWGKAQSERADWAAELGVKVLEPGDPAPEYLYWVGCASSFDERARKTAQRDRQAASNREASTSRSSAPARAAPATPRAGSATNTCSRPSPSRTSRRSTTPA